MAACLVMPIASTQQAAVRHVLPCENSEQRNVGKSQLWVGNAFQSQSLENS
jgi:hypothetical protein